jgi:hypothetical protein
LRWHRPRRRRARPRDRKKDQADISTPKEQR